MFSSNSSQVSNDAVFVEDVFSTYLYTGNSSTQTITNGIDLSGKGGLVWIKNRTDTDFHNIFDTNRGAGKVIFSNDTSAESSQISRLSSFTSSGFTLGNQNQVNESGFNYASWTFRKQPKFFDVVTWTGDGTNNRQISHSLASVPGCVIVKRLNAVTDWLVWHRSSGAGFNAATLNGTGTFGSSGFGPSTAFTDTYFTVANQAETNASGGTFVAYVFAHDAGGFGLTGTDNVISCGSFASTGAVVNVTLGYEPQFLLVKRTDAADDWRIIDSMRGFTTDKNDQILAPNLSAAETNLNPYIGPTATGFSTTAITAGRTYIYIAIRRGPMKVPTSGTSVFALSNDTTGVSAKSINAGFPTDMVMQAVTAGGSNYTMTRLIGSSYLRTQSTAAESALTSPFYVKFDQQNTLSTYVSDQNNVFWNFGRAPSFFDEVCYTGTGSARTISHNLGVAPELMIAKQRGAAGTGWIVYHKDVGATKYLNLNTTAASATLTTVWNSTAPTSSVFSVGTNTSGNASGGTYVNYLFATCVGVSKVGNYTGTGTTLQVDCGFTGGARFVLIKRTDSTGDWYVWDSARGIVAGNDPYLLLNSTAAEVTSTDYIDTYSAGFEISSTAPAAINASGGTYIFLAIA